MRVSTLDGIILSWVENKKLLSLVEPRNSGTLYGASKDILRQVHLIRHVGL